MTAAWILGSFFIVATLYVTSARIFPIKVILGYATSIDLIFTVLMFSLFHGTMTGLMAATLAGLILAISLSIGRWLIGYQRIAISRNRSGITIELVTTPGKLHRIKEIVNAWMILAMTGLTVRFGGSSV